MASNDDMVNNWGVNLLNEQLSFTRTKKTANDLDRLIKQAIPGYQLRTLTPNGTTANSKAMEDICFEKRLCLIAMGSYVGGDGSRLQELSSSTFDKNHYINEVVHPSATTYTRPCFFQTVPFPYHINHRGLNPEYLFQLEAKCLRAIELKLTVALLNSRPYRGLLMEPMLSGNGGELTDRFLTGLAVVLKRFDVKVILDEVMTGGRVGPKTMLMLTGLPSTFRSCVEYVTMGKILNCGIVLEKKPRKPTDQTPKRGESTLIEPGEAYMKFKAIANKIKSGAIASRRSEVLKVFGLSDEKENINEDHWGRGCFIFTTKARPEVKQNLKCRLLPKLESTKLSKLTTKESSLSRTKVCGMLFGAINEWCEGVRDSELQRNENNPFLVHFAFYLIAVKAPVIFPNAVISFIGEEKTRSMADEIWTRKRAKKVAAGAAGGYKKKAISYVHEMLADVAYRNPGLMSLTRKGKNRMQGYIFHYEKMHTIKFVEGV